MAEPQNNVALRPLVIITPDWYAQYQVFVGLQLLQGGIGGAAPTAVAAVAANAWIPTAAAWVPARKQCESFHHHALLWEAQSTFAAQEPAHSVPAAANPPPPRAPLHMRC